MATSIIENILGNNKFYTDTYIKDTITLVKSITVKNVKEASLYNDYLKALNPHYVIPADPAEWRYYHHLMGWLHEVDSPVTAVSVDNGETIEINIRTLLIHRRTKEELLKFGSYYSAVVERFPQMELYLKAVITDTLYPDLQELIDAPDYTIVSYDHNQLEENEGDVIPQLQLRINNYKSIWLIGYYAMMDNLFLASQIHIFGNFLVTSLLAIRLANAKTMQAHSYHIRLYLASHHYLDESLLFLTRKQQLFLYRNMLYLNNHSGSNFTFRTLIDLLFTERNISVINYEYRQSNTIDSTGQTNYRYNQKLLNNKPLVVNAADISLSVLAQKERPLAPGNAAVYDYGMDESDHKHRNTLVSQTLSKDIETILMDETDSVRWQLLQTLTDNWAYLLKEGRVSFLTTIVDPSNSMAVRLPLEDLFKLYLVTLYASHGISLEKFPTYRIQRVFKQNLPTFEQLLGGCYSLDMTQKQYLQDLLDVIPGYSYYLTGHQFEEFVTSTYKLNLSLWLWLTNLSDMDTEGQMQWVVHQLTQTVDFDIDTEETVSAFLDRVGLGDPRVMDTEQLSLYLFNILDHAYDKRLTTLNRLKKLQDALTRVLFKFTSYTVQLINNYYGDATLLVGPKDTRYTHTGSHSYDLTSTAESSIGFGFVTDVDSRTKYTHTLLLPETIEHTDKSKIDVVVDLTSEMDLSATIRITQDLPMNQGMFSELTGEIKERSEWDFMETSRFSDEAKIKTASEVFFHCGSSYEARSLHRVQTQTPIPINAAFSLEPGTENGAKSSDSDLLFLALNL